MKIAVTSVGSTLEDQIDPRFGRARYFIIVDTTTMEFEAIENPNLTRGGGAGVQSAQLMADRGVEAILTGNCGPNAYRTLTAADIDIVTSAKGSVADAVARFKSGELNTTPAPNVADHYGMGNR